MKKNFFFGLFALATMLFTASCSEQELVDPSLLSGDVVTFTVNLQQSASTRAAAELAGRGTLANKLYYGVYEKTSNNGWALIPAISALTRDYTYDDDENHPAPAAITYGSPTQVEIKLAKQKEYSVIFWAANAENNMCNVDWTARTMTVSDDVTANNENNDVFWAYDEVKVNAAVAKTVDLYRPFAQLNIGASNQDIIDAAAAEMVVEESQIVLKKVANIFNMETGEASGNTTLTYRSAAILNAENWQFPVDGHKYIALGYVLANTEDKSLVDVELTYTDTKDNDYNSSFTSVPVQRNYRTNIYGNLLSNSADYNVNVQPDLGDGDNVVVTEVATTQQLLAAIADPDIDHVVMTGDIDLADLSTRAASVANPIEISRDITIDGKGFKVKTNGTRAFRIAKSNVNVVFNKVNIESRAVMQYPQDIRGISIDPELTNVVLTLNNCSVDFTDATACDWAYAVNVSGNGTGHTVTVNGGSYEGANVINIHGSNNTIVVKDATLTSLYPYNESYYGACVWVLQKQGSSVEATGNTFNGSHAVAFNVGTGTTVTESDNTDNTIIESPIKSAENVYSIFSAQALKSFSDKQYNGVTLNICADIDLNGSEFKAIAAAYGGSLTVNGKGKTIKNAKVVSGANDNSTGQASFFYPYTGSVLTIKDLMFDNIEVDASIDGSGYAGVVVGYAEGKVILDNVDVNNADVYGQKSCGALVGFRTAYATLEMNGCDVTNSKVEAKEDRTGAYVGRSAGITTIANCSVDDNFTSIAPDGFANKYIGQRYESCTSLTIDGKEYVDVASNLKTIISNAANDATLMLAAGTYNGLWDLTGKTLTIEPFDGATPVIDGLVWADNCTVTLKGLTLTNTKGVKHPNPSNSKYFNTINEQNPCVGAYSSAKIRMENCTFNLAEPTIYGFYGYAHNSPEFVNCTFNCNKIRPIANNGPRMTVTGCTFNSPYHYAVRIFENATQNQTVTFTNNTIQGSNDKGEFEGINISRKNASDAVINGTFTVKGNTDGLKYRHHKDVRMGNCTYDTDIANFEFESEN